jgi:hypothetical protein
VRSDANPLKAVPILAEANKTCLRTRAPHIVKLPALVPYLAQQLQEFQLLEDSDADGGLSPPLQHPIKVGDHIRGCHIPMVYPFSDDFQTQYSSEPGQSKLLLPKAKSAPSQVLSAAIPKEMSSSVSTPCDIAPPALVPSKCGNELTVASMTFSITDECKRSKNRMESIKVITLLPTSDEPLREWVLNLNVV